MPDADIAVIGAGAAGLAVAFGAAQLGQRVMVIDRDGTGGDAAGLHRKSLLAAVRQGAHWHAARAHVRSVAAAIAPAVSEARYQGLGVTVMKAEARFVAPDAILAGGRRITARRFVVATRTRPSVPPITGLADTPYWTSETLLNLTEQPGHLLILGGGPAGLEMADAFAGLGCQVTLVTAQRIAAQDDPELAAGLRMALMRRGVAVLEQSKVTKILARPTLILEDGRRIEGSHLLVATGERPDWDALDLAAGAIKTSTAGIVTDTGLRSVTNRRVFAVGGIVLRRILFRLPARLNHAAVPRVICTHPELAQTGLTEAQAIEAGLRPKVLRWPMTDNDRAIADGAVEGLVKLVISGKRAVGAGILAPGAGEMISLWSLAIAQRTPLPALARLTVPYPTRSEAGKRAAGSVFASTLLSERTRFLVRLLSRLP
jgi:pyruvate/2-oxoglutarate dehydrogenase complex dihydrolipoamide dehydrogenase (E3) component